MDFKGKITMIGDLQTREACDGKVFKSREVCITEMSNDWPQSIVVKIKADLAEQTDLRIGDIVNARIRFRTYPYKTIKGEERMGNDVFCSAIQPIEPHS